MRTYRLFMEIPENTDTPYNYILVEFNRQVPAVFAYGNYDELSHMRDLLNNRFPTDDGAIKP